MGKKVFDHIAVVVNDPLEIKDFYIDILGLEIKRKFSLSNEISSQIFDINKNIEVAIVGRGDFTMELFITSETNYRSFQHACIMVTNREKVIEKAKDGGYSCYIIKRKTHDTVFIQDKSNNLFEIKKNYI